MSNESTNEKMFSAPPILDGYTYDPAEAYDARDNGRLLAIRIETNTACNLLCQYCYAGSGGVEKREVPFARLQKTIDEASDLGIRSVVVIGGGEPTMYSKFRELISYIASKEIVPVVFTNTIKMDQDLARFLYDQNASVMGKLDSFKPDVQDRMAGVEGAFKKIYDGIYHLLHAGFDSPDDPHRLRLGVSFVTNALNINEIEQIWHFCRKHNIFPNMEILTPTGRAKELLSDCFISLDAIRDYKMQLLELDKEEYGYNWLPYTPLTASGCLQHLYSMYITLDGDVRPCAPTKYDEHPSFRVGGVYPYNVWKMSMKEIYNSEPFAYARTIDQHLEGKCGHCEYIRECIGCRGYAFSVGVNNGLEPYEALRMECQQCFK